MFRERNPTALFFVEFPLCAGDWKSKTGASASFPLSTCIIISDHRSTCFQQQPQNAKPSSKGGRSLGPCSKELPRGLISAIGWSGKRFRRHSPLLAGDLLESKVYRCAEVHHGAGEAGATRHREKG